MKALSQLAPGITEYVFVQFQNKIYILNRGLTYAILSRCFRKIYTLFRASINMVYRWVLNRGLNGKRELIRT